jgi:uncharacterized protein (TIRG00374 family)
VQEKSKIFLSKIKSFILSKYFRLIIGIGLSAICIYFLLSSINHEEVISKFKNVNLNLLSLALFVTFLSYVIRTIRWKYFFKDSDASFFSLYRALILGFFMNNVLPARIGELVRCHSLGTRTGQSRTFVLATVAAERLADGLTISALFGLSFYFSDIPGDKTKYIGIVALMFLAVSIFTVIGIIYREKIFNILKKIDILLNKKTFSFFIGKIMKFMSGLEPLLERKLVIRLVFLSILIWGVELFAYFIISNAFNEILDFGVLTLFLATVNFSSLIPAAPGSVGVIENFGSKALNSAGINYESAVAMVVAQHAIQYIAVGIPGLYFSVKKGKIKEKEGSV